METRLYADAWADGSLDLVAGAAVVLIGAGYLVDQPLVPIVVAPVALVSWLWLKQRIVEPRTGRVEFRRERRRSTTREAAWALGFGAGCTTLVVVLALVARRGDLVASDAVDGLPAVLVALAAGVGAILTRSARFAWYGLVLVVAAVGTVLAGGGPGLPLLVGGAVVVVTGGALLRRLLAESRRQRSE
jgi:hypothetical protein